jgi:hypothetical protein
MKTSDAVSNHQNNAKRQAHGLTFAKVIDGRKQPIRGLWIRGARYYARLNVENPITGIKKNRRVPLIDKEGKPVQTVTQAVAYRSCRRAKHDFADSTTRQRQIKSPDLESS